MPEVGGRHFAYNRKGKRAAEVFRKRLESRSNVTDTDGSTQVEADKARDTIAAARGSMKNTKFKKADKNKFEARRAALRKRLMQKGKRGGRHYRDTQHTFD